MCHKELTKSLSTLVECKIVGCNLATVLCWLGVSRPSAYVGIVGLRVWTPTGELSIYIPRGSRPSNRVGIVQTHNYKHEIVLLA